MIIIMITIIIIRQCCSPHFYVNARFNSSGLLLFAEQSKRYIGYVVRSRRNHYVKWHSFESTIGQRSCTQVAANCRTEIMHPSGQLDPIVMVVNDSGPSTNKSSTPQYKTTARCTNQPAASKPKRGQANRRERVRTENVNAGFDNLRRLIPTDPSDRKLSKIEILRLATSYINHLYNLTRAE